MKNMQRRSLLKTSAVFGGTMILPRLAMAKGTKGPSGKVNVALIGAGGIAKTCYRDCDDENVVAVVDVDSVRGAEGLSRFSRAKRYKDFRKMLDKHWKQLDAVIVSTPDHTHFAATCAAMERGIAVHTQKPLTHNLWQARTLQAAALKYKVQTVMGNQGHNFEGMRLIKDWYDAGLIGEVREVHAWTGRHTPNNWNAAHPLPAQRIPATLDWDLWSGPVAVGDYNSGICPGKWRWWWQYGSGGLGDIGCHTLDVPKYAMGLGYPDAVYIDNSIDFSNELTTEDRGKRRKKREEEGEDEEPSVGSWTYVYEFNGSGKRPPVKVFWYEGGHMPRFSATLRQNNEIDSGGCLLIGDKNTIYSPGMRPQSPRLENDWEDIRRGHLPPKTTPRAVGNPVQELFAAIRGDIPKCGSNFVDYAVPLTEMVLLGTIANRTGKKVEYDPKSMTFKDGSLNQYVKEPVRKGWEYGDKLI